MKNSVNKLLAQIARDSVIVAICTIAAKAVTAGKDIYLAGAFGIGDTLDIYLIGLAVPLFLSGVIISILQSLSIPEFVRSDEKKTDIGGMFQCWLLTGVGIGLACTLICLVTSSWIIPIITSGFDATKTEATLNVFFILINILWIRAISATASSILHARKKFVVATISQAALPAVMIAVIYLWLGTYPAATLISLAALAGFGAEAILLLISAYSEIGSISSPKWAEYSSRFKLIYPQAAALLIGSIALGLTILIDQAMASSLDAGSVSALGFGLRIAEILIFLTAAAISTSVFPYFSNLVEKEDFEYLKALQRKIVIAVLGLSLVPTIFFFLASEQLVSLVYERGLFTDADSALVAQIQALYVLQVPFYTASLVYVRLFSAIRRNEILMISTLISVATNVIFNYWLMQSMGVAGIALSTSLVNVITLVFLAISSNKILSKK